MSSLPRTARPAPWTVECDAVLWVSRPSHGATDALARPLRGSRVVAVVGAVVRYSTSPVGPYAEVLGAVGGLGVAGPWASVPFMAVDSEPSLVGGRTTWGLPKTLAGVDGSPGAGTVTAHSAEGHRWAVTAAPR